MRLEPHSIRLFPKQQGADAYVLSGVAARCDWVVLSDTAAPHATLVRRVDARAPRHVFLSMRAPFHAIRYFAEEVLPHLTRPFVLVSGSEDVTIPHQTDARWRGFSRREQDWLRAIRDHPLMLRWFAENLDDASDPRFAPLPTGLVGTDGPPSACLVPQTPALVRRKLRALCAHRVRAGRQWDLRRGVTDTAKACWGGLCTTVEREVVEARFVEFIERHAFVICARGGGLDPSPKAWLTLLHGAIPIIADSPLRRAYRELPVVILPDWRPERITAERLKRWRDALAPWFEDARRRREVIDRLGLDYWWRRIEAASRAQVGEAARPRPAPPAMAIAECRV